MKDHGYNLRQRPFPVLVSTQSPFPISTTVATTDSSISGAATASAPTREYDSCSYRWCTDNVCVG